MNTSNCSSTSLAELSRRLVDCRQETRRICLRADDGGPRFRGEWTELAVRVYDVVGRSFTIAVAEDYAQSLDEVRRLRLRLEDPAERQAAERQMAEHPFAERALPEDILVCVEETPDPDLFWSEAILFNFREAYVSLSGTEDGAVRFSSVVRSHLREKVFWAWSCLIRDQEDLKGDFWRAACLEAGRREEPEGHEKAWNDWFGIKLCAASSNDAIRQAAENPLRFMVMAQALERTIPRSALRNPTLAQAAWLQRTADVRQSARRNAESVLKAVFELSTFDDAPSWAVRLLLRHQIAVDSRLLEQVTELNLNHGGFKDDDLRILPCFSAVRRLDLRGNPITDAGLEVISGLPKLVALDLWNTKVTSLGVRLLSRLGNLEQLDLGRNDRLTDACVDTLAGLGGLRWVSLPSTISTSAVDRLRAALPNCDIRGGSHA